MATVTKSYDPENLALKDAIEIIAAKVAKGSKPRQRKTRQTRRYAEGWQKTG